MGEGAGKGSGKVEVTLDDVRAAVAVLRAWIRQQREVERLLREIRTFSAFPAYSDPMKQIIAEAIAKRYKTGEEDEEEAELSEEDVERLKKKAEEIEKLLKQA